MSRDLKTSPAQARARDKWKEKNREKQKKYVSKSHAKRYISDLIESPEELEEVKKWVEEAEKKIKAILR